MIRRYAERRQIIDHPNERSSHSVPTPRGGGWLWLTALFSLNYFRVATDLGILAHSCNSVAEC